MRILETLYEDNISAAKEAARRNDEDEDNLDSADQAAEALSGRQASQGAK
jgi:hypothetical protein